MLSRTVKEAVRHAIGTLGLARLFARYRRLRGENVGHLLEPSRSTVFASIYANRVWLNGRASGSRSGLGSELENTARVRADLPSLLRQLGAASILDVGCGDWTWMAHVQLDCRYIGIDIVPEVVEQCLQEHAAPNRSFLLLDAVTQPLPRCDAVLCREVLFHLSFEDAKRVIDNVRASGAKYLLATTDSDILLNAEILTGDFRLLNLRRRPFRFPEEIVSIPDGSVSASRTIGVWRVSDLSSTSVE